MAAIKAPFYVGAGGAPLSEDGIKQRRKMAEALMKSGSDYSPIGHWTQGLARVANALVGGYEMGQLRQAETEGRAEQAGRNALLSGADASFAASAPLTDPASGGAAPSFAGGGSSRTMAMPDVSPEIRDGIVQTAAAIGADPIDLATAISYETGGTFNPTQAGPTTKWGQHRGLIQFGEPQAKQHGVDWSNPVASQLGANGAIASYMRASGYKPGMNFLDLYSTINAGAPGLYNRSDTAAGGAPGTVLDKVEQQMAGHRAKAQRLFADLPAPGASPVAMETGQPGFAVPGAVQSVPGDDPGQLRADAQIYAQSNPEAARQMLARAEAAEATAGARMPPTGTAAAPSMNAQTFNAISAGAPPLDPAFQAEGVSQPWMASTLPSAATPREMVARALASRQPLPPSRPVDLSASPADLPAPGAVPAMGQQVLPETTAGGYPTIDPNSPDAGARAGLVASEEARRGLTSGAGITNPFAGIVQALQQGGGVSSSAPPSVTRVAQALTPQTPTPTSPTATPSAAASVQSGNAAAPAGNSRLQAAYATLNSPYANSGERAIAQMVVAQAIKGTDFESITRPDGSVWRVPKTGGGAPVQVFGPQSKPEGPTGDMREYELYRQQERAAGREPGDFTTWSRGNKSAGATSVNIDTKGAGKFAEKANELQAKRYGEMVDTSDAARQMQGDLDMLEGMSKGIATGRGAEVRLGMAQFAKAWGFDDIASGLTGGKLGEMEAFGSMIDKLTPQMRQGMPGAASDRDVAIFRNALPNMLKTPEGNHIVMQTLRAMNDYKMRAGDLAGQALRGDISQADADKGIRGLGSPFARFKEYRADQDKPSGNGPAAAARQPEAPIVRKSVGGKSYVKRGAEWFEE